MPLVRIDTQLADPARMVALGDAVHAAMVAAFSIPDDDLFQVLTGAAPALMRYDSGYLGVRRDDPMTFVQVTLRRGRTEEQKRAFYAELARRVAHAGIEPRNLLVVLTENGLADWSFGEGVAQYLDTPQRWSDSDSEP